MNKFHSSSRWQSSKVTKVKGYQGQRSPRSLRSNFAEVKEVKGHRGQNQGQKGYRGQRSSSRSNVVVFSSSRSQSRSRVKLRGQFERKLLKIVENCVKMPVEGYWSWFEIWKCLGGCHNAYFSENCRNCQKFFRNYARFA